MSDNNNYDDLLKDWVTRKKPANSGENKDMRTTMQTRNQSAVVLRESNGKENTAKRHTRNKSKQNKKVNTKTKPKKKSGCLPVVVAVLAGSIALAGLISYLSKDKDASADTTKIKTTTTTQVTSPSTGGPIDDGKAEIEYVSLDDRIADLVDYDKYVYLSTYQGKKWYFAPQDKIMEIAYTAIEKMEHDYAEKKAVSQNSKGEYIAEWITPEFLTTICFNESSYRIIDANGEPLNNYNGRVKGCTQILDTTANDIVNHYDNWSNDDEFTDILNINKGEDPRYNPFYAMCLTTTYFQWMHEYYINNPEVYNALGIDPNNMTEEDILVLQNVAAGGYFAGIGGMKNKILSGEYKREHFRSDQEDASEVNTGLDYVRRICEKRRVVAENGLNLNWESMVLPDGTEVYYQTESEELEK